MKIITSIFFMFFMSLVMAQEKGAVEGVVLDNEMNKDPFAFVNVSVKDSKTSISTDLYGTYYLDLEPGRYTLEFKFAGYQKVKISNISIKAGEVTNLKNVIMSAVNAPQFNNKVGETELERETTTLLHNN